MSSPASPEPLVPLPARPPVRRVLMTADTVGGVWSYALELARALGPRGVCVDLATLGAPLAQAQRDEAIAVPGLTVHDITWRLEWMDAPWDDVRASGEWLLELEARLAPDVVQLNGYCHGALPFQAPVLVVAHSCVLSWWEAVKHEPAPPACARYREEVARGLQAAHRVAAPTRALLDAVERHYGALPSACVIPNARRAECFVPTRKKRFVLAAGRLWDEAKNLSALEAVAPLLGFPILVAGETARPGGSGAAVVARSTRSLGMLSSPELAGWMSRAAVYALPARYEPFGLSALEAALAGCALVLGDIPSLREVWGSAARFVDPEDPGALAQALRFLMDHPEEREALAARGRRRALTFTPHRMVEAYLDLYAGLARRARHAS